MSDTDSAVLPYALPDLSVGNEIGQMKLVHKINSGIFIRKKLYAIIDSDNLEVIKSSGIDSKDLTFDSFKQLLKGESIEIIGTQFKLEWKNLNVNVVKTKIILPGIYSKVKTIYNTPDVNYKFISLPIKYNLIIHPMFPYIEPLIKIRKTIKTKPEIISKESDFFLIFSKFEIILFFVLLFISLLFIYLHYFKI